MQNSIVHTVHATVNFADLFLRIGSVFFFYNGNDFAVFTDNPPKPKRIGQVHRQHRKTAVGIA